MLSISDIQKLTQVFATKDELRDNLHSLEDRFNRRFDDVMTKMDQVYGEVVTIRQEQTAHQQQHEDIRQELDEIKSLPTVASELHKSSKKS